MSNDEGELLTLEQIKVKGALSFARHHLGVLEQGLAAPCNPTWKAHAEEAVAQTRQQIVLYERLDALMDLRYARPIGSALEQRIVLAEQRARVAGLA